MNDLKFSAKKVKLMRSHAKACKVHGHSAGSAVASVTCTRSSQPKIIRNKQASALDGALDKERNEVDSEAEDNICRSEMDIET